MPQPTVWGGVPDWVPELEFWGELPVFVLPAKFAASLCRFYIPLFVLVIESLFSLNSSPLYFIFIHIHL